MPRPQLSEEVLGRLAEVVDDRTKVPVAHLSTQQRVELLLDEFAAEAGRADRLESRVDSLEEALDDRNDTQNTTSGAPGDTFLGGGTTDDRFR